MGADCSTLCSKPGEKVQAAGIVDGETLKFLSSLPLFKRLPKDKHEPLASCAQRVPFSPGEKVVKQGDTGDEFFVIMSGEASVHVDDEKVATLKRRDYFGEVALLREEPRNATITAMTDLQTLKITRAQFQQLDLMDKLQFPSRKAVAGAGKKQVRVVASNKKSPAEQQEISTALRNNENLKALLTVSDMELADMIDLFWSEKVAAGNCIITEGDVKADYFYIVKVGKFEISVKPKEEGASEKESQATASNFTVEKGGSFGELALLYFAPRAATVKATVDCEVWVIDRANFKHVLEKAAENAAKAHLKYFENVPLLEPLKEEEKLSLAQAMTENFFHKDEEIFRQGDEGDTFYILVDGEVGVYKDGASTATLKPTADKTVFFGELALLNNAPRAATIKVLSATAKTLSVERKAFDMLLGPLEELNKRGKHGTSNVKKLENATTKPFGNILRKDLKSIGLLGCGGFGAVELVEHQVTKETYALKSLSKGFVVQSGMQQSVISEKDVQLLCDSHFVIKLYETFNEPQNLLLLLELALGGELYATYERKGFHGKERHAQFYSAGVVFAFAHLHEKKILYRDLKPENLLLNDRGNIKLTDMGLAKVSIGKTYTTCGTPDYFAPELIESKGHTHAVDWWTLGILIYELLAGKPPFEAATPIQICKKVKSGIGKVAFPPKCKGPVETLIKGLCEAEPSKRLPMKKGGAENVKKHVWYKGFDWKKMNDLTMEPPYVPDVKGKTDIKNFNARREDCPPQVPYKDDGTGWDKSFATSM